MKYPDHEAGDVLAPLTERQEKVLTFIERSIDEKGYPPTRAEIAECFDIWPNAAQEVLEALVKKERVKIVPKISRGIQLVRA